uniref:Capsid protein n=1 Tax=Antarctic circular DNA molecule TaxID=2664238 RepID=A0A5Q2F629_9ZZZZ|nr:capsid protein [Antarctic circular DNA molecule]
MPKQASRKTYRRSPLLSMGGLQQAINAIGTARNAYSQVRAATTKRAPTRSFGGASTARKLVSKGRTVHNGSRTYTLTKKKKNVFEDFSNENHHTWLSQKARKPTAMKLIQSMMEPQWYRVQGLTAYDTTAGFYSCSNRSQTDGAHILPAHVWDLTASINIDGSGTQIRPNVGFGLYKYTTAGNSPVANYILQSQDATGSVITTSQLQLENVSGGGNDIPRRKSFHLWSHIKMNLYGVRRRSTKFSVQLVQVNDVGADFLNAPDTNIEKQKLFDYLLRPYIFSNLNTGDPQSKADIKILKSYEVVVAPNSLDQFGGTDAVPHMQTVNWFVNHNAIRHYDWRRNIPQASTQLPNFDEENGNGIDQRTDPKYRIYLLIRALSPDKRAVTGSTQLTAPDPLTEPSYDLVLKQKFSNPT